jgi:hypothetical protein
MSTPNAKHKREAKSLPFMFGLIRDLNRLNAARVSAAGSGSTLLILYSLPIGKKMQSSLATRTNYKREATASLLCLV